MEDQIKEILYEKEGFFDFGINDKICAISYLQTFFSGEESFSPKDVRMIFESLKDSVPTNIPARLGELSKPKVKRLISLGKGRYKLYKKEEEKWEDYFSINKSPKQVKISKDLEGLLKKVKDQNSKEFLKDALSCYKIGVTRATIIMTWILVINRMQEYILSHKNKLLDFNNEWIKVNKKNKAVTNLSDFSDIKEEKFIELCRASGIVDNNERKILDQKLGIRNTASHPNSIKIKDSKVIDFVEDLIENILVKFI